MALRIFTNLSSLNSQRAMSINSARLGSSLERIATGIRLQRSGDDIGAMSVSEALRGDITALKQGAKNLNDGIVDKFLKNDRKKIKVVDTIRNSV